MARGELVRGESSARSVPSAHQGGTSGLTRVQAERELRKRIDHDLVLATAERKTLADAGALYIDHLEHVMDRKRSTIQDYRGYLRGHLEGFFAGNADRRIDPARVASYLKHKRTGGPVEQDGPEPPELPAWRLCLLAQARLGPDQSCCARGSPQEGALAAPAHPLPAAPRARQAHRRGPRRSAGRRRAAALFGRGPDRTAPRRVAGAEVDGRRLAGRPGPGRRQLHPWKVRQPQVPRWPLGADGRPSGARARASLPALGLPHRRGSRLLPSPYRQRARPVEDAKALR